MKKFISAKNQAGFGLVEVVVGAAVVVIIAVGVIGVFGYLARAAAATGRATAATFLLEEGAEAARLLRDAGWANLADLTPATPYYLTWGGANFATSSTPSLIDGTFTRTLRVDEVYRDASSEIVTSGGALDPETHLVTIAVGWTESGGVATTREVSFYLTNLFE